MPKLHPIQQSFSAGEITPLFYGRSDQAGYRNGVEELVNFLPNARGPVIGRDGTKYISRHTGNDGRIETVQVTESEYFFVLFTDLRIDMHTPQGQLPGNDLVTNGDFANGGTGWTVAASTGSTVDFAPKDCTCAPYVPADSTLSNPSFDLGSLGWTVRESHVQSNVTFTGGTCVLSPRGLLDEYAGIAQSVTTQFIGQAHKLTIDIQAGSDEVEVLVGTTEDGQEYLAEYVTGGTHQFDFTPAVGIYWVTVNCHSLGSAELATILSVDVSEPQAGHTAGIAQSVTTTEVGEQHYIRISATYQTGQHYRLRLGTAQNDGTYLDTQVGEEEYQSIFIPSGPTIWITIDAIYPDITPSLELNSVELYETVSGGLVGFDTPYIESDLPSLQVIDAPQGGDPHVYIFHRSYPPYKLTYNTTTEVWSFTLVTWTAQPAQWTAGNYPVTGAVYQGRLYMGGPLETFWASVPGSFEDLTMTQGALDDEALEFTLSKYGEIRWMSGFKTLLIGAENGEHIAFSETGIITPSSIQVEQQSSYGSALVQPIQVGDQVFYVSPDRRKVRAIQYEWTKNTWMSNDLTFSSEHITVGKIKTLDFAPDPGNLLLCALQDGGSIVLQYDRPNNVYGWTRIETQGKYLDEAVASEYGTSKVALITQRVDGNIDMEITDTTSSFYMDSCVDEFGDPRTVVSGLDHLEGMQVGVITDGALHPDRIVQGGQITLQWEAEHVVVGLTYQMRLKTLPLDVGSQTGSAMSYRKRRNKIYVKLLASTLPKINGQLPKDRTPSTPMNTREPARTQDVFVTELGWDQYSKVEILQDLPLETQVLAIYGEVAQETL